MKPTSFIIFLYTGALLVLCLEAATTTASPNGSTANPTLPGSTSDNSGKETSRAPTQSPIPTQAPTQTTNAATTAKPSQNPSAATTAAPTAAPPPSSKPDNGTDTPAPTPVTNSNKTSSVTTTSAPVKDTKTTSDPVTTTPKPKPTTTVPTTPKPDVTTMAPTTVEPISTTAAPTTPVVTTKVPTTTPNSTVAPTTPVVTTKVPTTTPNSTVAPTTPVVTTKVPTTTPNSTVAPTTPVVTTKVPTTTPNSTVAPTTPVVTTKVPTTTPNSTVAPTTPVVTTKVPTTTPNSTVAPTTTQAPVVSTNASVTTQAPTDKPVTSTEKPASPPSTSKPSITDGTTKKAPVTPGGRQRMYINEIMLNKDGSFQQVELFVTNDDKVDLAHYAIVMVDGSSNKTISVKNLTSYQHTDGLIMVYFNDTNPMMKSKGIGVAIYDTTQTTIKTDWTVNSDGLVDALVIGKTYEQISDHLVQTLTPGMNPFVLDPSLYGQEKTITRCSDKYLLSTDMFALLNPSIGTINKPRCEERLKFKHNLGLKFKADCKLFTGLGATGEANTQHLMHFVIKEVNKKCQCGLTRMHIQDPTVSCCGGTDLKMKFVAPNQEQGDAILTNYKLFIQTTTEVAVNGTLYKLDNSCYSNCCATPAPSKQDDKSKNIRVTVAVVVTCLLIFLVIVILVVLYMRRKKTAVYQFRMSRLEEDEDYPMSVGEQDDFVGGQEATFDIKA